MRDASQAAYPHYRQDSLSDSWMYLQLGVKWNTAVNKMERSGIERGSGTVPDGINLPMVERYNVVDMIVNGEWAWPNEWKAQFRWINDIKVPILEEGVNDCIIWKDNSGKSMKFSIRSVWEKFKERKPEVSWYKVVWYPQCNPRHAFIVWLAMHRRLATQDRIMVWNKTSNLLCPLCKKENDSHEHLFFKCPYSKDIWSKVKYKMRRRNWSNEWEKVASTIAKGGCKSTIESVLDRMVLATMIYFIWNERNKRIFAQEQRNCQDILNGIVESIKMQLMCQKNGIAKAFASSGTLYLEVFLGELEWLDELSNHFSNKKGLSEKNLSISSEEAILSFSLILVMEVHVLVVVFSVCIQRAASPTVSPTNVQLDNTLPPHWSVGPAIPGLTFHLSSRRPIRSGPELDELTYLMNLLAHLRLFDAPDSWSCLIDSSRVFTVRGMRHHIFKSSNSLVPNPIRWNKLAPAKINISSWRITNRRLPTLINLDKRGIDVNSVRCQICDNDLETEDHLFVFCDLAIYIWKKVLNRWNLDFMCPSSLTDVMYLADCK
uniref:Reverse transcriptase zinc-binding domain-containing protein n=1 Tax=Tanacetum cinerariifolium TaxID=118510 RepID=A0A6L2NAG4_TANCI|nr:hypothetical protein [Tanacetum cinerariifolium]